MAKAVTLKNTNDEEVYPVTDISLVNGELPTARIADDAITTDKIADEAVTSDKVDWATLVASGTWTTTSTISATGGYIQTTISVSSFGFTSPSDYAVILTNRGSGTNGWAVTLTVSDKTSTSFKITQWNSHWSGGAIGAGNMIDWAVIRTA